MSTYPIRGGTAVWEIQTAILQLWESDQVLKALALGGFHDQTVSPETKVRTPYVVLGNVYENERNILTNAVREVILECDVFSSYDGKREISAVVNRMVYTAEHQERNFVTDQWVLNSIRYEGCNIFLEAGMRRALVRFVATLEPKGPN